MAGDKADFLQSLAQLEWIVTLYSASSEMFNVCDSLPVGMNCHAMSRMHEKSYSFVVIVMAMWWYARILIEHAVKTVLFLIILLLIVYNLLVSINRRRSRRWNLATLNDGGRPTRLLIQTVMSNTCWLHRHECVQVGNEGVQFHQHQQKGQIKFDLIQMDKNSFKHAIQTSPLIELKRKDRFGKAFSVVQPVSQKAILED